MWVLSARFRVSLFAAVLGAVAGRRAFAVLPMGPFYIDFKFGSTEVYYRDLTERTLHDFVELWKKMNSHPVCIVGHSDAGEASEELSRARAEWVKDQLVALDIPPSLITIEAETHSDVPDPRIRRVEIILR